MKKPQLKDYGLKESDFSLLESQKNKFKIAKKEYIKRYKILSWILLIISCVIIGGIFELFNKQFFVWCSLIVLVIGFVVLFQTESGGEFAKSIFNKREFEYVDLNLHNKIKKYNDDLYEYEKYKKRISREFWLNLNPYRFEREVAKVFEKNGYEAHVTKGSGDGGIDIILKKDNKKYAVQCKHYKGAKISPAPIRELFGVIKMNNFDGGFFVSLDGYSLNACDEAERMNIELLQLNDLISMNLEKEDDEYDNDYSLNNNMEENCTNHNDDTEDNSEDYGYNIDNLVDDENEVVYENENEIDSKNNRNKGNKNSIFLVDGKGSIVSGDYDENLKNKVHKVKTLGSVAEENLSTSFKEYLLRKGYKESSSIPQYINSIFKVADWENTTFNDICKKIDYYIYNYDIGAKNGDRENEGQRIIVNSLKKLREFLISSGEYVKYSKEESLIPQGEFKEPFVLETNPNHKVIYNDNGTTKHLSNLENFNINKVVTVNSVVTIKYLSSEDVIKVTANENKSNKDIKFVDYKSPLIQAVLNKKENGFASYDLVNFGKGISREKVQILKIEN